MFIRQIQETGILDLTETEKRKKLQIVLEIGILKKCLMGKSLFFDDGGNMKKAYALWKSIAVWKKIIVSILLIISILAGFGVAKVQMIYTTSLNHITRDEDTSFSEMNLDDIELEKDDEVINILLIGNDLLKTFKKSKKNM